MSERVCSECGLRPAAAIVAVDNTKRLCCMECVAKLKAERKSKGQRPNASQPPPAPAPVEAPVNGVPPDKLCQRCRVNVRQAKVVLRGETILACAECVKILSAEAKQARDNGPPAAPSTSAAPPPSSSTAAVKMCEKCGLQPRKAKIVVNKTQVVYACKPCALEFQAKANAAALAPPPPTPLPVPSSSAVDSMREDGPLPPMPALPQQPVKPLDDEDDDSTTEYQPAIDLHPEPAKLAAGRAALTNSIAPPPLTGGADEDDPPPPAPDADDAPPPQADPLPLPVPQAEPQPQPLASSAELPRPMNRGMSLAPPPVNLSASLPPPVAPAAAPPPAAVTPPEPAAGGDVPPPKAPRVVVLPQATRALAPVTKPMSPPPVRAAAAAAAAPPPAAAAPKLDGLEGMLSELQMAMKRDVDRKTEQRKMVEEKVVAQRMVRQSRRATKAGGPAPFVPIAVAAAAAAAAESETESMRDNSLALLWEECEAADINDDERSMMLDERSKLVAELCATERTFATMVKQALRIYFDPLFSNRAPPPLVPVQRSLIELDPNKHVLALVGALQLIAKSSERLATRMDEMKAELAKARGGDAADDERLMADAPIGKLLLRDSEQLFELCSTLCVQQLPDGAAVLRKCEASNNDVAKYHTEQRNKSFALRDYPPLRSVALPAERLVQWCALLRELVRCTPPDHPDYNDTADMAGVLDAQLLNDAVDPADVYARVTAKLDAPAPVQQPAAAPQPQAPAPMMAAPATRLPPLGAAQQPPPLQPQPPQGAPQVDGELSPRRMRGVALMPGLQMDEIGAQRARLQKQVSTAGPPPVMAAPSTRGPPPPMRRGPGDGPPPMMGGGPPPMMGGGAPPLGPPASISQRGPPGGTPPGRPAPSGAPFGAPMMPLHQSPPHAGNNFGTMAVPPLGAGFPPERPTSPDHLSPTANAMPVGVPTSSGAISSITVAIEPGRPLLRCPVNGCVKAYYSEKDIMLHYKLRHPNEAGLDLEAVIEKAEADAKKQLAKEQAKQRDKEATEAPTPPGPVNPAAPFGGGAPPGGVASPFGGGAPPGGAASPFAPPGPAGAPFGGGAPPGGVASPFGGGAPPGGVASPFGGGAPPGGVASPFGGGAPPFGGVAAPQRNPQPFGVPGAGAPNNPPARPPPIGRGVLPPLSARRESSDAQHLMLSPRERLPTMTRDAPLPPPIAAEIAAGAEAPVGSAPVEEEVYGKLQLGPKPADAIEDDDNRKPVEAQAPPMQAPPMRMPPMSGNSVRGIPPPLATARVGMGPPGGFGGPGFGGPPPGAFAAPGGAPPPLQPGGSFRGPPPGAFGAPGGAPPPVQTGGSIRGPPPGFRGPPLLPATSARRTPNIAPVMAPTIAPPPVPPAAARKQLGPTPTEAAAAALAANPAAASELNLTQQPPQPAPVAAPPPVMPQALPSLPSARRQPPAARRAEPASPPAPVPARAPIGGGAAAFFGLESADYSPMVTQAVSAPVDADGIRLSITCGTRAAASAKLKAASAVHGNDEVLGAFACTWNDGETFNNDEPGEILLTDKGLVFVSARGQSVVVEMATYADARQLDDTSLQIRRIGLKPVMLKHLTPPVWAYGGSVDALEELVRLLSQFQSILMDTPDAPPPFHREWMAQYRADDGMVDALVRVSTVAVQVTFPSGLPQKRYMLSDLERWAAQGEKASIMVIGNIDHLRIGCPDAAEITEFLSQCSTCVASRLGLLDEPAPAAAPEPVQQQPPAEEEQQQWQQQPQQDWQQQAPQQDWQQQQQQPQQDWQQQQQWQQQEDWQQQQQQQQQWQPDWQQQQWQQQQQQNWN